MSPHLLAVTPLSALGDIGSSLEEAFFMLWATLWALILGFGLSGVVQAFVSRRSMRAKLGDHGPAAVARASAYGAISSSCSYAASAMARSLFAGGADFLTSMVFMFASTNLVVELGIVLVVLIGWQFAVSEFVGGAIMIVLLVMVGGVALTRRHVDSARSRVTGADAGSAPDHGRSSGERSPTQHSPAEHSPAEHSPAEHCSADNCSGEPSAEARLSELPWRTKLRSTAGWVDAASYTMADLTMLRKEMVVGFVVAGLLAVLVPTSVWNAVFIQGHGVWTRVENAVVGPFIAMVSFVCSIGNVPLAAALWKGGISFGGVVSFIFADLIALPLVLIYRRFYGTRMALRLVAVFWLVMAVAGLATGELFGAAGLVPSTRPARIAAEHVSWDYTTFLNIVFLAVFALLYWLHRQRRRLGGGAEHAVDPWCGMQVERANAPATTDVGGERFFFCSDRCRERFEADRHRLAGAQDQTGERGSLH